MRSERAAGTCLVLAAGMMLATISNAGADACWNHWKAKLDAQAAAGWRLVVLLKQSGDCAYVPKLIADHHQYNSILRAVPCENMTKNYGLSDDALRAKWTRYCKPQTPTTKPQEVATARQNTQPTSAPSTAAPPSTLGQQQSADCSTITGLGGGSGPSSCTPSTGVPPNVQAQITQAQSYMQAAQTVKQSDPSYNGWSAAAAQYRKAEAAYRAANDLAQASAAAEQAQTLENALKIADQKAGQNAAASQAPSALPQASPSASTSPASSACPPIAPAGPWQGSNAGYCASAGCVDRGSAYYGMLCYPSDPPSNYKPQPDPHQLGRLATNTCGQYSRATEQCFADTKLKAILAARPDIRDYCEKQVAARTGASKLRDELAAKLGSTTSSGDGFVECVDDIYLHGFDHGSLRQQLADALRRQPAVPVAAPGDAPTPEQDGPRSECPPGQVTMPTPGAFGARSCQPIGTNYLAGDKDAANSSNDSGDGAASLAAFENRVTAVAAEAAAAAAEEVGGDISEQDRQACLAVAYAEARSAIKGGAVQVPAKCKAMANAALSQLAYYVRSDINDPNPAMDELLASFNMRPLGGPLPGVEGLTPLKQ
jgi:hypothetical protein